MMSGAFIPMDSVVIRLHGTWLRHFVDMARRSIGPFSPC